MKKTINFLFFIIISTTIYGQINWDSLDNVLFTKYYNDINKKFALNKKSEFEFRLWTQSSLTDYVNLFIMTERNNKKYSRFFELKKTGESNVWTERVVEQVGLDSIWKRLLKNKVLVLPTQKSLQNRMHAYEADSARINNPEEDDSFGRIVVKDGTGYRFEIISEEIKRHYNYANPASYLKHYPNIEEFYRAYLIINIIRKYVGLPLF